MKQRVPFILPPSSVIAGATSQRIIYTSLLAGVADDADLSFGSTNTGTDQHARIQAALTGGNVELVVDGHYGLAASLVLSSHTTVRLLPGCGFIMQAGSNAEMFLNAHVQAPNIPSGAMLNGQPSGGMAVSNQADFNITICGPGILNCNSTGGAVTGTDNTNTAHKLNPATGLWVNGMRFIGVDGLFFADFTIYDSATYSINHSNTSRVRCRNVKFFQPFPLVHNKNTDGFHTNGCSDDVVVENCVFRCGDDSIAMNADDGQEARFNDPSRAYGSYPGVVFGPITNFTARNNYFLGSANGVRMLSLTERIDNVVIDGMHGTIGAIAVAIARFYPDGDGPGNFGRITLANIDVDIDGSFFDYESFAEIYLNGTIEQLFIHNLKSRNPISNRAVVFCQNGTMNLHVSDLNVYNPAGPSLLNVFSIANATLSRLTFSGVTWTDNGDTGAYFLGGATAPASVTISGYSGPNRLLSSGFNPAHRNGDAFQNT